MEVRKRVSRRCLSLIFLDCPSIFNVILTIDTDADLSFNGPCPVCDSQRVERKLCSAERTVTVVEIIRLESSEQVIDSIELTLAFALAIAWTCEKLQEK